MEKFDGRLHLIKLPRNIKKPGLVRNVGIKSACGKYIAFLDSDDLFTKTALEELSGLAEEYQADVVRLQKNFNLLEGKMRSIDDPIMTNFAELINPKNFTLIPRMDKLVDKPTLEPEDITERVREWFNSEPTEFWATCLLFWRRKFLVDNKIFFSDIYTCEDAPFTFEGLCLANRVLNAPNCIYIIRPRKDSISRDWQSITLKFHIHKRLSSMKRVFEEFDRIMKRIPFFEDHNDYRYSMFNWFLSYRLSLLKNTYKSYSAYELNELVKCEFHSDDALFGAYLISQACLQMLKNDELDKKLKSLDKKIRDLLEDV